MERPRATQRTHRVGNDSHPAERFTEQKWLSSYFVRPILVLATKMPGGLVSTGRQVEGTQRPEVGLHRAPAMEIPGELQGFERTAQ